jgi:hypothetical protein
MARAAAVKKTGTVPYVSLKLGIFSTPMLELQQPNTFNGYGSLVVDFRISLQNGGEDG